MSNTETITVAEIQETQYGEKAVIDSPYDARHYLKFLPWQPYQDELDDHGSLKGKAKDRGTNIKTSEMLELFDAMEQYGFSKDFATHVSWDPDALGGDGAWTIDAEAVPEAADFWQFVGYTVETGDGVDLDL